jgi:hypothetical protein
MTDNGMSGGKRFCWLISPAAEVVALQHFCLLVFHFGSNHRLATFKINSKRSFENLEDTFRERRLNTVNIYTHLRHRASILCKARECCLTLSLCDIPLLSQGEGRFGEAETR